MNIRLRKYADTDYEAFAAYIGPAGLNMVSPPDEKMIRLFFNKFKAGTEQLAVDLDGQFVGSVDLKPEKNNLVAELGISISPNHQHRGIATQAVAQLVAMAFGKGIKKIWARTTVLNIPSIKLLLRAGFTKEGHMRNQRPVNGTLVDEVFFGLTLDDYNSSLTKRP